MCRRYLLLVLLCAGQFILILDFSVVNVALPSIRRALAFSRADLQWVISIYALTYGGFLLLGGRTADLYGRRRLLVLGLGTYALASLGGGLATSQAGLICARAVQGLAAAAITPSALSLITTTFKEGPDRNRAVGIYGAVLSTGFLVGVLLGGFLIQMASWRGVMFMNALLATVTAIGARLAVPATRGNANRQQLDVGGATAATVTVLALVYGLAQASRVGWTSREALLSLLAAVILGTAFVVVESRCAAPLVPLRLLGQRRLAGAHIAAILSIGSASGVVLILTLYFQEVLDYTPAQTGTAFTIFGLAAILAGPVVPQAINRVGLSTTLVVALGLQLAGTVLLIPLSVEGVGFELTATGLIGFGEMTGIVAVTIQANSGLRDTEQGLGNGLINTSIQVGTALGVGIMGAIAGARTQTLESSDSSAADHAQSLVSGFQYALTAGSALVGLAAVAVAALIRDPPNSAGPGRSTGATPAAVPEDSSDQQGKQAPESLEATRA